MLEKKDKEAFHIVKTVLLACCLANKQPCTVISRHPFPEVPSIMPKSKSKAQAELADIVREAFPTATVRQEVPLGRLIDAAGYLPTEIARELGHSPHRMAVDVYAASSDMACAFEYQGEQHYRAAGNMNASANALLWDQQLDEEKGWVLRRIGTPIVYVPFDAYVDAEVLSDMVADAVAEVDEARDELVACEGCGRLFPVSELRDGLCRRCVSQGTSRADDKAGIDRYGVSMGMYGSDMEDSAENADGEMPSMFTPEGRTARKAADKARRKAAREAYKQSPEYQRQKEEARRIRKERYREQKERMKRERLGRE